jgi:hypothetical protein
MLVKYILCFYLSLKYVSNLHVFSMCNYLFDERNEKMVVV